uniref:Uncharacterized protein n=1 Tax=Avena sativa TaxID=4498 RepID=A0ACD5XEA6_AVESA
MRDTFRGEPFLEYISALGRNPLGGADRLDLATAKSQLRSFNRLRGPRELPEFVTYAGIEDVPTEATPQTKRKRMEKTNNEDDVPSKEKKPRRVESSLRKSVAAKEDAVDEERSVPRKSSARKNKKGTSKDVDKREAPAKKNTMVEASSVPSSKENKPKVSKSLAEKKKKKDSSKYTDKRESLPEPVEEEAMGDDSSTPRAADGTFSKERKSKTSKSSAKMMKKDSSKDIDKGESPPEPAVEDATNEDSSMPSGEATDGTLSKGRKSKVSKSSSKAKKKDISKDTDKKESLPESVEEDAMNEDNSTPSGGVTDGTLRKRGKSKISKSSTKAKKNDISKDADKKKSLPDPAKEEATGDDSSTPEAADGTLSKERNSKITKSPVKKKKQDTSKDADGVETVGGSKTPVKKAVDGTLSESKSARRLRSMHKTEDASERSKGPRKDDVGETTKGKDKDVALLKENNLGRRASSARQKDKITADGVGLADSSVKDSVSPGKKKSQLGETSVTKDAPISISEHGRKRKKLSELMVETGTPNRSPAGKSKARGKHSLPASTEKPDLDTEGTVKARGKRSLPASTEKPDRDTEDTVETRGKRSLPALTEKPEEPDCDTEDTKKTRGKRSMPALTEKPEDPDRDTKDKMKTRGKRSLPGPTEEPEDPDRDMKDTMKTMKRKKLDTLGDLSSQPPLSPKGSTKGQEATPKAAGKKSQASPVVKANGDALGDSSSQPQPLSPKRFTKAREAMRKAAELNPHTSPAVEANSEASQTRSRRNKNSEKTVPDKSPRSVKPNKGKKGATTEDSLSCGEMHSQLCLAASDLKKVGKITPASVGFFTEFSKSSCPSSSDVEKEIPIEAANTDSYASSAHGDKEMTEKATDKVPSPQADEEIPEEAANKVASPHADEEIPEKAENKVASPHADEEIPEKPEEAANKVASPHADEEIPEKAANKVSSPHAEEEIPEKATNKVGSPRAEEEVPEKPTEKEPSPSDPPMADHMKEVPEKPTDKEPSPSEPSVAAHMKDDYWADILINVEEPISSLKKKKDKSKTKTSKTKELQAEAATPKELPVSMGNVEPEEPKAAECKQDNTENGKAEAKPPMVANGGQQANAEETAENLLLTGLVMHFSRPDAVPSHSDLVKIFSQYGPVSEARTQTGNSVNSATVIFKRRMDAEGAFCGAGNMTSVLGPGLVSFRLSDFPSGASGNGARQGASSEQRPW